MQSIIDSKQFRVRQRIFNFQWRSSSNKVCSCLSHFQSSWWAVTTRAPPDAQLYGYVFLGGATVCVTQVNLDPARRQDRCSAVLLFWQRLVAPTSNYPQKDSPEMSSLFAWHTGLTAAQALPLKLRAENAPFNTHFQSRVLILPMTSTLKDKPHKRRWIWRWTSYPPFTMQSSVP